VGRSPPTLAHHVDHHRRRRDNSTTTGTKNDGTVNSARSRQREPAAPGNGSHRHITITARTGAASRNRYAAAAGSAQTMGHASVEPSYHVHHVIERVPSHRAIRLRCRRRYAQRAQ